MLYYFLSKGEIKINIDLFKEAAAKARLIQLYKKASLCKSSAEIEIIYLQALKELVKLSRNDMNFQDDLTKYFLGNCYTYALGLPSLDYLIKKYCALEITDVFPFNVGFINSISYYTIVKDKNAFLNCFLKDIQALNIQTYETDEQSANTHGGYKIAVYLSLTNGVIQDFHFIRQNSDGTWSHKNGYYIKPQITVFSKILEDRYEHFGTFEIVKPTIR